MCSTVESALKSGPVDYADPLMYRHVTQNNQETNVWVLERAMGEAEQPGALMPQNLPRRVDWFMNESTSKKPAPLEVERLAAELHGLEVGTSEVFCSSFSVTRA